MRAFVLIGARLTNITVNNEEASIEINDKKHNILVVAKHAAKGLLAAPQNGVMDRRIAESVDASIRVSIVKNGGQPVFSGTGSTAGLELVGNMNELQEYT